MLNYFLSICFLLFVNFNLFAKNIGSDTGYKIPRFVSLKSNDVNLRIGSSTNYPIILKYTIKALPVEVIDEYQVWRKINDIEGNQGWIHKTLIQGDRYAIINQEYNSSVQIYSKPKGNKIGKIGKFNIVKINTCLLKWCQINYKQFKGWNCSVEGSRVFEDLPEEAKTYIHFLSSEIGVPIEIISIGPKRHQILNLQ